MTCPFYVCDGRPSCLLGEPDGRHCGPRQYPVSACNLDEIGEWGAWRAVLAEITEAARSIRWSGHPIADDIMGIFLATGTELYLVAVGWSP